MFAERCHKFSYTHAAIYEVCDKWNMQKIRLIEHIIRYIPCVDGIKTRK